VYFNVPQIHIVIALYIKIMMGQIVVGCC